MTEEQITLTSMSCSILFSLIAGGFALYTFRCSARAEQDAENAAIIRALQGEKESVIFIAHRAAHGEWDVRIAGDAKFRDKLVHALCVAWPMERSARARAAIFRALVRLRHRDCGTEITEAMRALHHSFRDYQIRFKDESIEKRITLLNKLCVELNISLPEDDLRLSKAPEPPPGTSFAQPVSP